MKLKIIIIALVATLSGIFFWQTTNRFLYPSKAAPAATAPTPLPYLVPTVATGGVVPTTPPTVTSSPLCKTIPGDANGDGVVNLADFEAWRHARFP